MKRINKILNFVLIGIATPLVAQTHLSHGALLEATPIGGYNSMTSYVIGVNHDYNALHLGLYTGIGVGTTPYSLDALLPAHSIGFGVAIPVGFQIGMKTKLSNGEFSTSSFGVDVGTKTQSDFHRWVLNQEDYSKGYSHEGPFTIPRISVYYRWQAKNGINWQLNGGILNFSVMATKSIF